jgi:hypothetical protein
LSLQYCGLGDRNYDTSEQTTDIDITRHTYLDFFNLARDEQAHASEQLELLFHDGHCHQCDIQEGHGEEEGGGLELVLFRDARHPVDQHAAHFFGEIGLILGEWLQALVNLRLKELHLFFQRNKSVVGKK